MTTYAVVKLVGGLILALVGGVLWGLHDATAAGPAMVGAGTALIPGGLRDVQSVIQGAATAAAGSTDSSTNQEGAP